MRNIGKVNSAFFIQKLIDKGAAFSIEKYPLKNSAILDSGTTIHIFNEIARFLNFRTADPGDFVWAGEHKVPIQGYGNVDIEVQGSNGTQLLRLYDVAFCEDFACNLVSLRQLRKQGLWWDNRSGYNHLRRSDNSVVAVLEDHYDQFVLEFTPENLSKSAFYTRRNLYNSWTERRPAYGDAMKWHLRLGHPGPQALQHLVNCSTGARIRGPTTVECDACGQGKMKRRIRRAPRDLHEGPGYRLAIDFHDFNRGYGGFNSLMLVTDRWSGLYWDYYLSDRKAKTIISALKHLFGTLKRQCSILPKVAELDNELTSQKPDVQAYLENAEFMRVEPSAPYTGAQNGGAERSGGVLKNEIRAMAIGANLPDELWPEVSRAAVYLHNRTPIYTYNWKSPYDRFHTNIAHRDGVVVESRKPQQAHLKVYGCKAFAMTTDALKKANRLKRLNPKAWIGFLVEYDSSNIYRIWNPKLNKVFRTRDVIFNEDAIFDGDKTAQQQELDELQTTISRIEEPDADSEETSESNINQYTEHEPSPMFIQGFDDDDAGVYEAGDPNEDQLSDSAGLEATKAFEKLAEFEYPTPTSTPPAALLAGAIREADDSRSNSISTKFEPWKAAFNAGTLVHATKTSAQRISHQRIRTIQQEHRTVNKARILRILTQPNGLQRLHRRDLPPEPKRHEDLADHLLGDIFKQAELDHLHSHVQMKSWAEVTKANSLEKGDQILDCMWVYVYKFNKHGRLSKCKARLVVRGDQQAKSMIGDTYAATLAARSFRVFIAIAARFDLDLIQYDAVNAFVHAQLDERVFMKLPPGYRKPGMTLKLNKALYGLRRSPLLWQKELKSALQAIGFNPVPHEPCCLTRDGILVFFYVDDIVFAYKKNRETLVKNLVEKLKAKYNLTGGNELQWFLGIEVIRDRERNLIWLSQSSYIDKIANLADSSPPDQIPMTREELRPYDGRASYSEVNRYQRKIGSLMYAAVTTRPDIAFAVSRLSCFLINPGPEHHNAADRVLLYLKRFRNLGLEFGGGNNFIVASDASFADNTIDRKSSQAYAMKLFNGLIGWRANKQDTVTTSTTEAELLALAQAAKEGQFINRLIRELTVELDDPRTQIQCDNIQTIRLVNQEIARLQTKLRHVDIHNHWLRQEATNGRINVSYTPSEDMIADGLTKALPREPFERFVNHMGLFDISDKLHERQSSELQKELNIQGLLDDD
jgi:Reverse transcriptase (RNA-dependent DNA polymerase)